MEPAPGVAPTALVTGASSGIGLELSRELTRRGYRVGMLAQSREPLEREVDALARGGAEILALVADVTRPGEVAAAAERLVARWGAVDLAIANAGIGLATWAAELDLEAAERMIRTNYLGMLHLYAAVIPGMLERGRGSFVGVASLAGLRSLPGGGGYSASKAAMQAFLDTVRPELRHRGVRVVTVNPWFVRTPRHEGAPRPLMVEADVAARTILDGVERGRTRVDFPWLAALGMRVVRALPDAWFDRWVGRRYRSR